MLQASRPGRASRAPDPLLPETLHPLVGKARAQLRYGMLLDCQLRGYLFVRMAGRSTRSAPETRPEWSNVGHVPSSPTRPVLLQTARSALHGSWCSPRPLLTNCVSPIQPSVIEESAIRHSGTNSRYTASVFASTIRSSNWASAFWRLAAPMRAATVSYTHLTLPTTPYV